MICNSGGVTNLSESFKLLRLSVVQSSFTFTNDESITIPATGLADKPRFLRAAVTIFVRKETLSSASVLKNNPDVDETIKLIDTRFQPACNCITMET